MKKRFLSMALALVVLVSCIGGTAWAATPAGKTATHKQDISMGDNKVIGQMTLEISNVTSELSLTAQEIVAKYPLSEEQKSRGYYLDNTSDYKWSVYECSAPAKVELKSWATYFVEWPNPSVNKDSIVFNEISRTEYEEDMGEDVKSYLPGTYYMFNEPGTYVVEFSQAPFGFNPFLVVVSGGESSVNQCQLALTGFNEYDDGHYINYELRNNTNKIDTSKYALVLYSGSSHAEVHYMDAIGIQPGGVVYGGFSTQWHGEGVITESVNAIIVKFTDENDKQTFRAGVPWSEHQPYGGKYLIEPGSPCVKWFNDTFGITLH